MDQGESGRSKKVVGLFLAAALTFTPGCSMNPFNWGRDDRPCTDANRDGYCDEDGRPVPSGNRHYRSSTWLPWRSSGGSVSHPGTSSGGSSSSHGVSTGSKGGIGSSSRSGGGSSGGSSGG